MSKFPLPRPNELNLLDSKSELEVLKEHQPGIYRWRALFGLIILLLCGVSAILLFRDAYAILKWFEELGPTGPIVFTLALSLGVIVLLPTPLVKVSAGAIFPLWIAVTVNFVASLLGGMLAFFLGRWLFRDAIQRSILHDKRMQNVERALTNDAMKISILVRLSPLIPDEWLNYMMSATPVSFRVYMISNCSGVVYSFAYAYYGHALGKIALQSSGIDGFQSTPLGLAMLIFGLIASLLATVFITRASLKSLSEVMNEQES